MRGDRGVGSVLAQRGRRRQSEAPCASPTRRWPLMLMTIGPIADCCIFLHLGPRDFVCALSQHGHHFNATELSLNTTKHRSFADLR